MAENKKTEVTQPTVEKKTNKQRLKDITDSIENGIKDLFESDKYKQYLQTMSRFHRYSVNNQMLIYMQKPNATHVAGFNKWRDQFGRNVKKGEKGIKIIAPTPFKKKVEETKLDPDTKLPMLDDNGKPITEEKEIQIPMFRVVSVFDVSQTDGKPLPQLASDLSGNVENYDAFMEAIRRSSSVPITFEPLSGNMDGYFSLDEQKIVIREGMSEVQTVSALLHELAHSKLHNTKALEEKLQEVEIFGEKALFFNGRIDGNTLPEGLYCYDLRGSDDDPGEPVAVEESVSVNHAGCIISAKPIDIPEAGFIPLDDGLNFFGDEKGIGEFLYEQYPEKAKLSRNTEEVQAESISFAVCAYYGIKTEENSFGYIASWSEGKELSELKSSLETINKTSNTMITDIDKHYAEVKKERGLDEKPELDEVSPDLPDPNITQADMKAYGYSYEEMLPLTKETAQKLFETNAAIYMLHSDNTEAMVVDSTEISHFDGIFGIEKEDWQAVKDNYLKNAEMSTEDDFDMIDGIINNGDNIHGADNQPTVAELESDVKAGKSISLFDLANAIEAENKAKPEKTTDKKPSLLAKLNRPLPPQEKTQNKSKEREM